MATSSSAPISQKVSDGRAVGTRPRAMKKPAMVKTAASIEKRTPISTSGLPHQVPTGFIWYTNM